MVEPVVRFTLFNLTGKGHGGDRRTAQISGILNDAGISWLRIPDGMDRPGLKVKYLGSLLRMIILYTKVMIIIRKLPSPYRLLRTLWLTSQFTGISRPGKSGQGSVLLWEMTKSEYSFIIPLFRNKGFRIIAVPHNLESIVPEQRSAITDRISPEWLNEEISLLKKCDQVFTISEEDSVLLNEAGIKSSYLPYYPSADILDELLEIRRKRTGETMTTGGRKKVLMLGSALNPPTRQGINEVIGIFVRMNIDFCELTVAGFGTDKFSPYDNGSSIRVLGELNSEELNGVIASCDVALVHQSATSGALTRIMELLIAGVPVIANSLAARSYTKTNGVSVYTNEEELIALLKKDLPLPPFPGKPENEIRHFIEEISV